jgi:uroporphyrinogen decarboxylase
VNDRFLRACRREPVDATPVWFMRQAGRALPEYRAVRARASLAQIVADPPLCAEVTLQPVRRLGVDAAILFADITTPLAGIGIGVRLVDGVGPVIDQPLRTGADVGRLRAFDPDEAVGPLLDAIRLLRAESPVPVVGFAGAPFTLGSYLVAGRASRDAGPLKALLATEPIVGGRLLDALADVAIAYLGAQVRAGVDAVQLFDSWAGALSPSDYRRWVAPRNRRILDALGALGVPTLHFSTGTSGMLDEVAAAGGDVIAIDWRVRLGAAWAAIGERGIQGNLDPAALLGPWGDVASAAAGILDEADARPGHVFNLGHGVLPETDPDRLRRLVGLVHERSVRTAAA